MPVQNIPEETIELVYQLAFFINCYDDADEEDVKELALQITSEALQKLDAMMEVQIERFDFETEKRSKIYLDTNHLLQWLTYNSSLKSELLTELNGTKLSQSDMIVRYIAHLARISTCYNSFHVICAFCLFLYNHDYKLLEKLADILMPEDVRFSDNFRKQKSRIKDRILKRFPLEKYIEEVDDINASGNPTQFKSRKFYSQAVDTTEDFDLINECLKKVTPWNSDCSLADAIQVINALPPEFGHKSKNPWQISKIEINRMHAIIHPSCHASLSSKFGINCNKESLRPPKFKNAQQRAFETARVGQFVRGAL